MKYILLVMLVVGFDSVVSAQSLEKKHALIERGDKIAQGTFSREDTEESRISEIGLERTFCYGTCPAYLVKITNDGNVTYEGFGYVERQGRHVGKIPTYQLRNVFAYINQSSFFELQDTYTYPVTDNPTSYTLVVKDGEEKIVKNYANSGPIELWSIEQHIESLLDKVEWAPASH